MYSFPQDVSVLFVIPVFIKFFFPQVGFVLLYQFSYLVVECWKVNSVWILLPYLISVFDFVAYVFW